MCVSLMCLQGSGLVCFPSSLQIHQGNESVIFIDVGAMMLQVMHHSATATMSLCIIDCKMLWHQHSSEDCLTNDRCQKMKERRVINTEVRPPSGEYFTGLKIHRRGF